MRFKNFPIEITKHDKLVQSDEEVLKEIREYLNKPISESSLQKILNLLNKLLRRGLYNTVEFITLYNLTKMYLKEILSDSKPKKPKAVSFEKIPYYDTSLLTDLSDNTIKDAEELFKKLTEKEIDIINQEDIKELEYFIEKLESIGLTNTMTYKKLVALFFKIIKNNL